MNKLAQYLNQHLAGDVVVDPGVLQVYSHDKSPLTYVPQMVVRPRAVNDVRKLLRFTWQLAEKGHVLPVTVRGGGTNTSGAALGKGAIIDMSLHLNKVLEYDAKQRLVRMQAGATLGAIQAGLSLNGTALSSLTGCNESATIGGALADQAHADWARELEVVLANGDILHTKKLSKREFNKKKGEQTFEATIYRAIDTLLEENVELVNQLSADSVTGFPGLADVRAKDGSFDLTPLFIGSQGSLGVVTELIASADFTPSQTSVVAVSFDSLDSVRDGIDDIEKLKPGSVTYVDGQSIRRAAAAGKKFNFIDTATTAGILIITFSDQSVRSQARKVKKLVKQLEIRGGSVVSGKDAASAGEIAGLASIADAAGHANEHEGSEVTVLSGAYVPLSRFEGFIQAVAELAEKRRVNLLVTGNPVEDIWQVRTQLNLATVGGKQLVFKLVEDMTKMVKSLGGAPFAASGEGRLASYTAHAHEDEAVAKLYAEVRAIFDPHGTLNAGVKQAGDIRELVKHLKNS